MEESYKLSNRINDARIPLNQPPPVNEEKIPLTQPDTQTQLDQMQPNLETTSELLQTLGLTPKKNNNEQIVTNSLRNESKPSIQHTFEPPQIVLLPPIYYSINPHTHRPEMIFPPGTSTWGDFLARYDLNEEPKPPICLNPY